MSATVDATTPAAAERSRPAAPIPARQAEGELERFFALSLDLLCIAGLDGYFKLVNPAFCATLGYPTEEILARPFLDFVHPDDCAATLAQVERLSYGERAIQFENRYQCKDGSWKWLSWNCQPFPEEGLLYSTARDVTGLKATEAELRRSRTQLESLFHSLPGLYLVLTPDLMIVAASDAYLQATMTTRENLVGRGLFEAFPDNPDDPAASGTANLRASLDRVRQTAAADTMAIQKYDIRRADGTFEERYWSPINSPLLGTDRRIEYIIHRVEDVTAFIKSQSQPSGNTAKLHARLQEMEAEVFRNSQAIQTVNQQLQAANADLESFSYSVSHDLRTPLRAIDGFAQMLEDAHGERLDETGRRYITVIRNSATRMSALIDDLLAFARLGRGAVIKSRADMDKLVREARAAVVGTHPGCKAIFDVGTLPLVFADPKLLLHVWINLLSNAVKYSQNDESPRIEVRAIAEERELVFSVKDNGAGFDMRHYGKLFGVFQRLHSAEEFAGTGVGLAIVQRVITRHGGRVWAEGTPGAGATFYFSIPQESADA